MIAANVLAVGVLKNAFPTSLCMLRTSLWIVLKKYVICEKCGSLYTFKETLDTSITGRITPKTCSHVSFRNHQRKPCGNKLLKTIITNADKKFYPCKTYSYYSLKSSISTILSQENLLDQCEHWRGRNVPDNTLADICG